MAIVYRRRFHLYIECYTRVILLQTQGKANEKGRKAFGPLTPLIQLISIVLFEIKKEREICLREIRLFTTVARSVIFHFLPLELRAIVVQVYTECFNFYSCLLLLLFWGQY